MKIIFCALVAILLCANAKELSFSESGIKSKPLDAKFLNTILDFPGEFTKQIVESTLEVGVTQVFNDASYGYDQELIQHIVSHSLESLSSPYSTSSIEAELRVIHLKTDAIRGAIFAELTSIYGLQNLSQSEQLDKELWNYVSQYPEKFGFTYSHYLIVKQANEILEKNAGSDVNDATKSK